MVRLTAHVPSGIKKQVEFLAFHRDTTSSAIVIEVLSAFLKNKKILAEIQGITNDNR